MPSALPGCQAAQIMGIVNLGVIRIQANKATSGSTGGFILIALIIGVNEFQLSLLTIFSKGKARLQSLKALYSCGVTVAVQSLLSFLVKLLFGFVFIRYSPGTASEQQGSKAANQ
jgi:hypothetical protein